MAGVKHTLMKRIRQRQFDFLVHVMRKHNLQNLVVTGSLGKTQGKQGVRDWSIWTALANHERKMWVQHSSSGLQKTECSSIARSPTSSTTAHSTTATTTSTNCTEVLFCLLFYNIYGREWEHTVCLCNVWHSVMISVVLVERSSSWLDEQNLRALD